MPEQIKQRIKTDNKSPRRRATSYDVAELAGVSQSAVSRVFQTGASASKDMRNRVFSAANKLGYRPNAIARGLITQRSNMVAVIISRQTNLYYPELLVQITQRFSEHGIRVLLFTLEHEPDINSTLDQVLQYRVDGVVTAATLGQEQLEILEHAEIPVIFYNRTLPEWQVNSVRCDQEQGERWLVGELVGAGHKRFAIISGPEDSQVSMDRTRGALQRLKELNIEDILIVNGDYSYASGRAAFAEIMHKMEPHPEAVIAANDMMAIGCIDEARETFQLRVPDEISVVGFDGIGPARFAAYDLSTVRQPVGRMSEAAVSMLIERIENPGLSPEKRVFSGEQIRGSSARFTDSKT